MTNITIRITEEERNELQRLSMEIEAHESIIARIVASDLAITGDRFTAYQEKHIELVKEYSDKKSALTKKYVHTNPEIAPYADTWNLDFGTCEMTVVLRK